MSTLIAIKSCMKDRDSGANDRLRRSWAYKAKPYADVRFFVGNGGSILLPLLYDEIRLRVGDEYADLPMKTREILRWSMVKGYDYTYLCDTDTYIIPWDLAATDYEAYDISGLFRHPVGGSPFHYRDAYGKHTLYPWPSGGFGYFVSRRAANVVINTEPKWWAEDMYVGQATGPLIEKGEFTGYNIPNYEGVISWHGSEAIKKMEESL